MRGCVVICLLAACGRMGFDARRIGGDATTDTPSSDTGDAPPPGWTLITGGDQTMCGIYLDRAYCWGSGTAREIGDGGTSNRAVPTAVALPAGTVTDISLGERHGCALVGDAAYCWGSAPPGNGTPSSATPVAVTGLPSAVTSIACGGDFTCAVSAGNVYCWGVDAGGALGNGTNTMTLATPTQVTLPTTAISVDGGNDHVMALLSGGTVWAWGHNDSGALGTGSFAPSSSESPVQTLVTAVQPVIAGWHACVAVSGAAQCWGLGNSGELGDGLSTSSASPVAVSGMSSGVDTIMTGGGPTDLDATCAVIAGETWCWGNGLYGRLGNGSTANEATPVRVQGLAADTVELALGYDHSCARNGAGVVHCWGRGDSGQLGDGASATSMTPVIVPTP